MHEDSSVSKAYSGLSLPAMPYELQDAMERAHLDDGAEMYIEMLDHTQFPFLEPYLESVNDLYILNALAEKLAALEPWQIDALEGLLLMEEQKRETFGISRIYDLAASAKAGACQVLYDAVDDEQLGRFYVENGFVPETEELPEALFDMLDYKKIGGKMRRGDGGIFLRYGCGYVVQVCDQKEEFKDLDLKHSVPDYTILLEAGVPDRGDSVMLKLPLSQSELKSVPDHFEVRGWCDLTWRCADCRIPSMCDLISMMENIVFINFAAEQLAEIPEERLKSCKALIEAAQPQDLTDATALLDQADEYTFSPRLVSPAALAKEELICRMGTQEADQLIPFVNLSGYGERLMESHNQVMTAYGVIGREDMQPFRIMEEQEGQNPPAMSAMEGMQM